jgi:hypothetical protein
VRSADSCVGFTSDGEHEQCPRGGFAAHGRSLSVQPSEICLPYVLVRHKVSDFSKWKPAYDAHLPARQKAGLKEEHLLRNTDDPNEVVLLFEAKDIQKAKEFASSADLREAMQSAGVVDKPDIYFLG